MTPCIAPIIWFLAALLMLLKIIFINGWFIWVSILVVWFVVKIFKGENFNIKRNRKRKQKLTDFYNSLSLRFQINGIADDIPINDKIEIALKSILKRYSCDTQILKKFHSLRCEFCDSILFSNARVALGLIPSELELVNGKILNVESSGWPEVNVVRDAFSFKF